MFPHVLANNAGTAQSLSCQCEKQKTLFVFIPLIIRGLFAYFMFTGHLYLFF